VAIPDSAENQEKDQFPRWFCWRGRHLLLFYKSLNVSLHQLPDVTLHGGWLSNKTGLDDFTSAILCILPLELPQPRLHCSNELCTHFNLLF